jgi:poly-beta-1,6-N-acetyl-D-glucosamine synthase
VTEISLLLTLFYASLLTALTIGIFRLTTPESIGCKPKEDEGSAQNAALQGISIIVAARNEEENIPTLLALLSKQNYPSDRYEVIISSDRSEDDTEKSVSEFALNHDNFRILSINLDQDGGKKRALASGIDAARFELLAFTDADCLPHQNWLQEINSHFCEDIDFIAGYSPLVPDKDNLIAKLKNLERISIFAVSAGSIGWNYGLTCVARNMAYRKTLYNRVDGFKGIEHIPSGDDDLMLQRMSPFIRKMTFMFSKDSFVPANEKKDISGQINLETRRASKWKLYPSPIKIMTGLVFLFYLSLLWLLALTLTGHLDLRVFLAVVVVKMWAEFLLLFVFCVRIKSYKLLPLFPLAELLHLPYFIFFALKGTFGGYKWKE